MGDQTDSDTINDGASMLIQEYAIIAGGLITASSLRLLAPTIKGKLGEWKVQSMLSGMKATILNDVIIADDRGLTQIDHLVLTPSGVVILETKNYSGTLYDRGRRRPWLQYIGGKKIETHNPLDQNYRHRKALENLIPGVPIVDVVVLVGSGHFKGQKPDGVVSPGELKASLRRMGCGGPVLLPIQEAWVRIEQSVRRDKQTRLTHLRGVAGGHGAIWKERIGRAGFFIGAALLLAGLT